MKISKYIPEPTDSVFGMSDLNLERAGLENLIIWSDHSGIKRQVSHRDTPRAKIERNGKTISVSIECHPKILDPDISSWSSNQQEKLIRKYKKAIKYIGRNYDLFLKHYFDTMFEFDDEDLKNALRARSEYK